MVNAWLEELLEAGLGLDRELRRGAVLGARLIGWGVIGGVAKGGAGIGESQVQSWISLQDRT